MDDLIDLRNSTEGRGMNKEEKAVGFENGLIKDYNVYVHYTPILNGKGNSGGE